jgi:cyclopropane-fatty-acyl-phospholipid synthase
MPADAPVSADAFGRRALASHPHSLAIERRLLARVLAKLGVGDLAFMLWDGRTIAVPGARPLYRLLIRDRHALWLLFTFPEYYVPELFAEGRLLLEGDLRVLLELVQRTRVRLDPRSLGRRAACALFKPSTGGREQARENIHHHYDLGNDFYRLWLDRRMLYTCAYFSDPSMSLEQAQLAKMDHVCRKLRLRAGERVVEAGCGWGALALHMAQHYGVSVRAFNISSAQLALARETAKQEGLERRVEFIEDDYRNIHGTYDAFVSVGMLEHVGTRHYAELGRLMDRALPSHGRGLIHTIGTDRPGPLNSWIERHIFPGAYPPALEEVTPMLGRHGFSVLDIENLRLHYAQTLAHWLGRFEAAQDRLPPRCDARFIRAWRFYLASSQASFTTGSLQLFQILFGRRGFNEIPWTRDYLYREKTL